MQSTAAEVESYLEEVPEKRRAALLELRNLCVANLDGYEESMTYRMPSYRRPGGDVEVAFASQARYISLYIMRKEVLDRFRDQLTTADLGKGCIRYAAPSKIDFDLVRRMLEASSQAQGAIC